MSYPFKKIAIAYSFATQSEFLFAEAAHIVRIFQSELFIVHAGEKTPEKMSALTRLAANSGIALKPENFLCESCGPERAVRKTVRENEIDLLIMGALNKERMMAYYSGSVARHIMRDLPCSGLIIPTNTEVKSLCFDKIVTVVDYTPQGETLLKCAYHTAKKFAAREIILVREIMTPGLAMTIHDGGSSVETESTRLQWQLDEEMKLDLLLREVKIQDVKIEKLCLFGKEGWETARYAHEHDAGLVVMLAPRKKFKLLDRVFQHDQEYFYDKLPCPLLLMKF